MLYKENKPYDSYLPKDCCPHWKKEHALKELATQVLYKRGKIYTSPDSCLVLDFPKPIYPPTEILEGDYNFNTDNPFDVLDAGMKITILTLLRENIKLYLMNTLNSFLGLCFSFEFRESKELKVETLHMVVRHKYELHIMGTKIEIPNMLSSKLGRIKITPLEFMTRDKERVYLESKLMEYMEVGTRRKIKLDRDIRKVISKVCTPEMKLLYNIFYKSQMYEWLQKGGVLGFVKDYLQKNLIDLREVVKNEDFSLEEIHFIQTYFVSEEYLIKEEFYEYLFDLGYKEITPSGYPSTISNYLNAIDKIVKWERLDNWEQLIPNISILVIKYAKDEQKAAFGAIDHNTVINALRRFADFVASKMKN